MQRATDDEDDEEPDGVRLEGRVVCVGVIGAILGDGEGVGKEDEEEAQQGKPFSS